MATYTQVVMVGFVSFIAVPQNCFTFCVNGRWIILDM